MATFVVKLRPSDLPIDQRPAVVDRLPSLLVITAADINANIDRYIEEKLGQSLSELDPPNLNAIAKAGDTIEVLKLCELVIAIAVQCERNQHYIHKIQSLPHTSQHALMLSLEQVTKKECLRGCLVPSLFSCFLKR